MYFIWQACRGTQQHEEVQLGLLYGILTDPKMAPKVMMSNLSVHGVESVIFMKTSIYSVVFTCYVWFQHYRDLTLVSRDGLTIVLTKTNQIIFEKWLKLLDSTRAQVGNVKRFKYFFMLICLIDMWWINECYRFYRLFGCARNWYKMEFLDLIVFVTAL